MDYQYFVQYFDLYYLMELLNIIIIVDFLNILNFYNLQKLHWLIDYHQIIMKIEFLPDFLVNKMILMEVYKYLLGIQRLIHYLHYLQ